MCSLDDKLKEIACEIRRVAMEALSDIEVDILPYVESDTFENVAIQTEQIVQNILAGRFVFDGDYIHVNAVREGSPRVRLAFTAHNYDTLRDKIIERMPKCPKDAKIAALELRLKESYGRRW